MEGGDKTVGMRRWVPETSAYLTSLPVMTLRIPLLNPLGSMMHSLRGINPFVADTMGV